MFQDKVPIVTADGTPFAVSEQGYLTVGLDSLMFYEQVDGTALNTNIWMTSVSTQTITQSSGFININAALSVATSTYAILTSVKQFPLFGHLPIECFIRGSINITPIANATVELGFGSVATTAAPTDGAFFRWQASDQTFRAVINANGTETLSNAITPPSVNVNHLYEITIVEDLVQFEIDDTFVAEIPTPSAFAYPVNAGKQTIFVRTYTGGVSPATAPQFKVGQAIVIQHDLNQNKLWKETLVSLGRGAYQNPLTPYTQSANHANSTDPVSATLSNTAAGYTTLGGRFQFAAVAGAVTDFALFAYQVPAGYQLYITGIAISTINTGAAAAVTATILDWSISVNASAVSLATAESPPATYAPRRIPLGVQGFVATAAIGAMPPDLIRAFDPPLVGDSGRFVHVILEIPVGTATALEVIRGDVVITGYFE